LEDERRGGRSRPVDALGDRHEVLGGDGRLLGVDSLNVLADDVVALTERMFAVAAELALAARPTGGDRDPIAGFDPRNVLPDCLDDAGGVATGDVWHVEIDTRESAPREHVEVVQRAGFYVDECLVPIGIGVGVLAVFDDVAVAVLGELDGLHGAWWVRRPDTGFDGGDRRHAPATATRPLPIADAVRNIPI